MRTHISAAIVAASVALLVSVRAFGFDASTVDGAVKASNAFGFDFYRQARKGQDNFVCSPAGAAIVLTMTAAGARGKTQAEILHTLHIDPANLDQTYRSFAAILMALKALDGKYGLELNVADRVCVQKDLKIRPDYPSLLREYFHAPLAEMDFTAGSRAALSAINQWASDETHGRIPKILNELSAVMVLANAVYMKGAWGQPFDERATYYGTFTTTTEETMVRMMRRVSNFRYAQVSGAKLVELPYRGDLSMIVVLPDDVDGLEKIEDRLGRSYAEWIGALKYESVDLELPRITATTDLQLVDLLKALGIRRAFESGNADFSDMTEGGNPFIGQAIQKTWIEPEAAAVTGVETGEEDDYSDPPTTAPPPPPPPLIFDANHPFMYVVRDVKSGVILFMGRMVKPAQ